MFLHRLLLLLLGLVSSVVCAQYHIDERLLINNGASNNFVRDLVLDHKGRLWIATESGLNAYNGFDYHNYNRSNSRLSSNMINCLWYDGQSTSLWVGTKGIGVGCIDVESGEVTNYLDSDSTLSNVLGICPSDAGLLWLISPREIMQLRLSDHHIQTMVYPAEGRQFRCGVDDGNGNLIVGTHQHGAYLLTQHQHQLLPLSMDGGSQDRVNVHEVCKDHNGRIWLATSRGLWYYQPGSTQLLPYESLGRREVFHIAEVDNRSLWLSTHQGLFEVDLWSLQMQPLQIEGQDTLVDNIQRLYQDPHGNIWIGGQGSGICFISHRPPLFRQICRGPVWGVYQDDSITWVGSRGHLLGFVGPQQVSDVDISSAHARYGAIFSIHGDGDDLLYLAVPYHCLTYQKSSGRIRTLTTPEGRDIEALTFYREPDGTLWITATDGVYTLRDGRVSAMNTINRALGIQSANGIRRDPQGKLWVATYENGIYLFDANNELLCNLSQQSGFFSNSIQHLKFDSQHRLWLSTPDGPCCIPDTRYPGKYVSFGYAEGLSDTYVRAIQEDQEGNVWMSTNNGISMLRYDQRTVISYSIRDYIPITNFTGGAVLQNDGGLVFTALDGLCHCYPERLTQQRATSSVHLLSVVELESGEVGNQQHILHPDAHGQYHLDYDHGSFRILLGSYDYADNHLLEYEYRVERGHGDWMPCSRGIVTFRNLQPGQYRISVRSRLKGQMWNQADIIPVTVLIHSPWWSCAWARAIYIILFLLLLALIIVHYIHRLRLTSELELERRKNIDEFERNSERLQFFANITHELKTPLTLLQAPLEELLQENTLGASERSRIQLVYDSSLRLTRLCNKLLDFRRAETNGHTLTVCRGSLSLLLQDIGRSYLELNTNPHLQLQLDIQNPDQPFLFDADIIRSILTNLLSNSLKYTPEGSITLRYRQEEGPEGTHAVITVADTGYGIPAEALPHIFDRYYQVKGAHQASGTGIGLSIVKALVALHQATIQVESSEGNGTTFTLTFDCDQQYTQAMHRDAEAPYVAPPAAAAPAGEESDDQRPLLLIAEDDTEILHFMADTLSHDYRVLLAHHGREALDKAQESIPDIVITDLMMPVMDGITLCQSLKNDLRTSHIPVIMLTAKDTMDDKMEGYASGADGYLTKPFSLQMLRTRIQNMLQSRARVAAWLNAQRLPEVPSQAGRQAELQAERQAGRQADDLTAAEGKSEALAPAETISRYDRQFLHDVDAYVVAHLTAESLRMEDIAQELRISHSTLYRKIKALTGFSGAEYIRRVRVIHSAELMRSGRCNVSEAAYQCGFSSMPYFRTSFREVFGMMPSEYLKQ